MFLQGSVNMIFVTCIEFQCFVYFYLFMAATQWPILYVDWFIWQIIMLNLFYNLNSNGEF